jgi:hypothetical protein
LGVGRFFDGLLTLWESRMAAVGWGSLPALFLSAACRALRMRDHNPLDRNLLKW